MSRQQLLEREAELTAVKRLILSARHGAGGVLVVEGSAGVGKSSLLATADALAGGSLGRSVVVGGSELETPLSLGVARQFMERLALVPAAGSGETGPSPVLALLLSAAAPPHELDELEFFHALHRAIADLAAREPMLLAVDDVQWADPPSLRFLVFLAQRLPHLPIALLLARRLGEPGGGDELIDRLSLSPSAAVTRLSPLSAAASAELVRRRLPAAAKPFTRACHRISGGNPFYLGELIGALQSDDVEPDAGGVEQLERMTPESVVRSTLMRIARLPEGTREMARAVALLGDGSALRQAAQLAQLPLEAAAHAADALAASAILKPGEPLAFAHPLLRSAVAADISSAEQSVAHGHAARLIAEDGAPPERVGAQLLAAAPAGDPWAVEQLVRASREAAGRGSPASAAAYLRRALEEPPEANRRSDLLVELGEAEALAGGDGAIERLEQALALTDEPRRAEVLYRLGLLLYRASRIDDSQLAFERSVENCPPESTVLPRARTAWLAVSGLAGKLDRVAWQAESERAAPPPGAPVGYVERETLIQLSVARIWAGTDADGARKLAERALADGAMLDEEGGSLSFSVAVSCLTWSDGLDAAERAIEGAEEVARGVGSPVLLAYVLFGRSQLRYWQGRMPEAAADGRYAVDAWRGAWSMHLPAAAYWRSLALLELCELESAQAVLDLADAESDWSGSFFSGALAAGRGNLALARGDAEAAGEHFRRLVDDANIYFQSPAIAQWRGPAAVAAARLGDGRRAAELVAQELAIARRFGSQRTIGVALRYAGLVERGEPAVELLRESVATLERSPARLELAKALVDLGAHLRAGGDRIEARDPLRRGLDLARRLGGVALATRARRELEVAGARPRSEALTGSESLTPAELRVATLAAEGLSNPQIAGELFLARKTVEWHLRNVYRKLEIGSRAHLAGALEDA